MTIKDIARESGYAVGTVSRVLNNHPDVSPTTREKILSVVAACNFIPNSNAKHLKQPSSNGIAVIVKGSRNVFLAGLLELLQSEIRSHGYPAFVTYLDEAANEVRQAQLLCRERKPLGILFLGSNLAYFQEGFSGIDLPCALITNSAESLGFPNLSSVTTDDTAAAAYCIRHLVRRGHRNIGILGGSPCGFDASCARLRGCREAFFACHLPFDPESQYQAARFSMESGYGAMERLLAARPGMTAVFAFSDVMAVGALRCLQDHHKRVPQDISLIGFDGIDLSHYTTPRLTTIKQADRAIAQRGAALVLEQIESGRFHPVYETVAFRLQSGESVQDYKTLGSEG